MSQLTSKFEAETGQVAMYRKDGADYHTLRYVNWLEALVEKFNSAHSPTNTGSPKFPSSTEVWNHVCEYSPALRTVDKVKADRRVSKLVYEFIRRKLRADA